MLAATLTLAACQQQEAANAAPDTAKTIAAAPTAPAAAAAETPAPVAEGAAPSDHPGAALHEEKCVQCHIATHDASFYQRAERKVDSYARLHSMVRMCDANLGTHLFDEDMVALGDFLNDSYYKFPRE
ncbi:MAG: hypothetical protein ACFCUG_02850 [Thiotrichales bacterium]